MIRQNEAFDLSFSKMLISGPFKVTEGQKFQKIAFLNTSVQKKTFHCERKRVLKKSPVFSMFVIFLILLSSASQ